MAEIKADRIVLMPIDEVIPYEKNPRKNDDAVDAVAASIKAYGFKSPILLTEENVIINGHTRLKAAKKLGMNLVPCIIARGLTEQQIKEYRLVDNKTSEYAEWDADLLAGELAGLDLDLDFDFDFSPDLKSISAWSSVEKLCDLKKRPLTRTRAGLWFQSLFKTGKEGKPLEEIKVPENVPYFSETAAMFITDSLGQNLKDGGWCIVTTPKRRHKTGFHFATEICMDLSRLLGIPFYEDVVISKNRNRLFPEMEMIKQPEERNVILYDDIITTGMTAKTTRDLLIGAGYVVYSIFSIMND